MSYWRLDKAPNVPWLKASHGALKMRAFFTACSTRLSMQKHGTSSIKAAQTVRSSLQHNLKICKRAWAVKKSVLWVGTRNPGSILMRLLVPADLRVGVRLESRNRSRLGGTHSLQITHRSRLYEQERGGKKSCGARQNVSMSVLLCKESISQLVFLGKASAPSHPPPVSLCLLT